MIRVVNKRTHKPTPNDVYIGRPSKWGNPFPIGNKKDRELVIATYELWIKHGAGKHLLASLHELKGKNLVCWCAPNACHGDILAKLAEETP